MTLEDYQQDAEHIKCYLCNKHFTGCVLKPEDYEFGYSIEGFEKKQALETNCPNCKTRYTITEFDIPHTGGLKSRIEQELAAMPVMEGMALKCVSGDSFEDNFYKEKCKDFKPPEVGQRYVVRTVEIRDWTLDKDCSVRLREIINPKFENILGKMVEPKFSLKRFQLTA